MGHNNKNVNAIDRLIQFYHNNPLYISNQEIYDYLAQNELLENKQTIYEMEHYYFDVLHSPRRVFSQILNGQLESYMVGGRKNIKIKKSRKNQQFIGTKITLI